MTELAVEPYFLYVSLTMVHAPFQDLSKINSAQVIPNKIIRNGMIHAMDKAVGDIPKAIDKSSSSDNTNTNFRLTPTNQ